MRSIFYVLRKLVLRLQQDLNVVIIYLFNLVVVACWYIRGAILLSYLFYKRQETVRYRNTLPEKQALISLNKLGKSKSSLWNENFGVVIYNTSR